MAYARDLLAQASSLITREPTRPKQASLRRGVSAAYYALFHLLVDDASQALLGRSGPAALKELVQRAFVHSEMKRTSERFAHGRISGNLASALPAGIPADLRLVATVFYKLQERRHRADYALSQPLAKVEAMQVVVEAEKAFTAWERVRKSPEARVYLIALLLGGRWAR